MAIKGGGFSCNRGLNQDPAQVTIWPVDPGDCHRLKISRKTYRQIYISLLFSVLGNQGGGRSGGIMPFAKHFRQKFL